MKVWLSIIFLFVSLTLVRAQDQAVQVRLEQESGSFEKIVDEIEQQSGYRIFYQETGLDSLEVTFTGQGTPVEILKRTLGERGYKVTQVADRSVIITVDREIRTRLPDDFFEVNSSTPVEIDQVALDFEEATVSEEDQLTEEERVIEIGERRTIRAGNRVNVDGYVRDRNTGEAVIGAMVYIEEPRIGVVTDIYGYYNIVLPQGRHELKIRSVGMKETRRQLIVFSEGTLDIELDEDVIALKEVVIEAEKSMNVTGMQMGMEKLDIAKIREIPTVLGESDIVKIALTLPGVQSVGEGASGFNVRGGAVDQNLILANEAIIYNPAHFFGFFSVFNPDVIKNATLLKSGIPAQYGGRVSSVFDIQSRDGNRKAFTGRGGISPVTARLTLEGPIVKEKSSFILGARSTYSDWLLGVVPDASISNGQASFYDISARISQDIGEKDKLYLSGYFSKDRFSLFADSVFQYQNLNGSFQWKHNFSNKLVGVLTGAVSNYNFSVRQDSDPLNAFKFDYALNSTDIKVDFTYFPSKAHKLDFGASTLLYRLRPGTFSPEGDSSRLLPEEIEREKALETAFYVGDNYDIGSKLSLYLGLRYSLYHFLGPNTIYSYQEGLPLEPSSTTGTTQFGNNEVIASYHGPEYRASMRYTLDNVSSLKMSYNRMRQYIHMLTNTTAISPTDTWKLSDPYIRPQVGDQFSAGYYRNFRGNTIESYIELYYKEVQDILEFKGGAQLLLNDQIETDLISGQNRSYGVEFLIKKKVGKLNGWLSYTYSRALNQVDGTTASETINNGEYFPANYDKPHSLNIIANYKFTRRISLSSNFVYSTGRPITYPVARYSLNGTERIFYSNRNEFRIPDYIRLDLSMQVEGNHKVDKPAHSSWSFAVYNLLGRRNAYSIFFVSENGNVQGYKLSVFGSAIPTVTYNFKF